ncbi:hypothetical protein [Sagittula stellata]|uniref:Uncharacterized protein n=1 Tax=Sagittula stellata (strain ATCC 700073 / DSM 11524 / E-37) TaxID=388399 RepID=A3JYC5_SAGS3|nr:hypothetical protein [Sagittula stellata]EBA10511.1 hypothetical protein SSE37_20937 [Sagittula stellata E-37]
MRRYLWILVMVLTADGAAAQAISMDARGALFADRGPMFGGAAGAVVPVVRDRQAQVIQVSTGGEGGTNGAAASLFAGRAAASFFAPWPSRGAPVVDRIGPRSGGPVAQLRDLIATAEAGRAGYDAVQHGARIKPPLPPTRMTLSEIYAWIDATPGQPHAIGRYQIIPSTLQGLVRKAKYGPNTRFTPAVQDSLADILLEEAGLTAFREGVMTRTAFMNNIAKIWAGLPNSSGRSHYHGYAGNKATMTWAHFESQMARIFPG